MSNAAPGFTRHPNHRVEITPSTRHVRVLAGSEVVAETRRPLLVEESRHDPVWYLPPDEVNQGLMTPTDSSTYCPFKGHASYYNLTAAERRLEDVAWSYRTPYDECRALAGYIAFYADRVTIEVDGEAQRPT